MLRNSFSSTRYSISKSDNPDDVGNSLGIGAVVTDSAPPVPDPAPLVTAPAPPAEISEKDRQNYRARCFENARFLGTLEGGAFLLIEENRPGSWNSATEDADIAIGLAIVNGTGLLTGWLLHLVLKRYYTKKEGVLNPAYRAFKTCAATGAVVGLLIAALLPLPDASRKFFSAIISDIASIAIGLFAVPYWYIREKILNIDPETNQTYFKIGTEGWTKTNKSLLVWGTYLGIICGAIYSFAMNAPLSLGVMALGSSIVGIGAFVLGGMVLLPLYNYLTNNSLALTKDDIAKENRKKDIFRNNYVRTGITLGLALGTFVGAFIPGVNLVLLTLAGAIGAVVGGVIAGGAGHKISQLIKSSWDATNKDPKNSWDYGTRATSLLFTSLGMAIGFFLPIPFGAVIGAAAGGTLGWLVAFPVYKIARTVKPTEADQPASLPWTQRCSAGTNTGMMFGAGIGLALIAILGGPFTLAGVTFGLVAAAAFCGSIGAVIGGIGAILYGKETRNIIKACFGKNEPDTPPPAAKDAVPIDAAAKPPIVNRALIPFLNSPVKTSSEKSEKNPDARTSPKAPKEPPLNNDYKNLSTTVGTFRRIKPSLHAPVCNQHASALRRVGSL
ncbi:MAG TPA: hypothetical protein VLI69_06790 [Gammaproteobacteria bacterium]|nr:hypothetical protein [Gammaproteobacteria bacterium]